VQLRQEKISGVLNDTKPFSQASLLILKKSCLGELIIGGAHMLLGYACINLTLQRTFRMLLLATLKIQGMSYIQFLVHKNMTLLADILRWNREHSIMMYCLSSELVPFPFAVSLVQRTFLRHVQNLVKSKEQ
jgi:UV DNA damage repair endonuclease